MGFQKSHLPKIPRNGQSLLITIENFIAKKMNDSMLFPLLRLVMCLSKGASLSLGDLFCFFLNIGGNNYSTIRDTVDSEIDNCLLSGDHKDITVNDSKGTGAKMTDCVKKLGSSHEKDKPTGHDYKSNLHYLHNAGCKTGMSMYTVHFIVIQDLLAAPTYILLLGSYTVPLHQRNRPPIYLG